MILTSFSYKESNWDLSEICPLNLTNLIVGRNSTGKTRAIRAIQTVSCFLQMKEFPLGTRSFSAELSFSDNNEHEWGMTYAFKVKEGIIETERLLSDGKELIKRTKTTAKYDGLVINPPSDKLIVQVRRDKNSYPIIEKLMVWAEGVVCVSCSDLNPFTTILPAKIYTPIPFSEIVEKLSDNDKKVVLKRAKSVGYNISSLTTIKANSDIHLVQIKETGVKERLVDLQLSNGMLRSIYLLCFLEYIKHDSKTTMLLIDDLGEGLDYGRSIQLGRMVFDDCNEHELQLIASSNDAFLMDVVDINTWQVLSRKAGKVSALNHVNNADLFRKFRMTGLSNFDLFSSDFIEQYFER